MTSVLAFYQPAFQGHVGEVLSHLFRSSVQNSISPADSNVTRVVNIGIGIETDSLVLV